MATPPDVVPTAGYVYNQPAGLYPVCTGNSIGDQSSSAAGGGGAANRNCYGDIAMRAAEHGGHLGPEVAGSWQHYQQQHPFPVGWGQSWTGCSKSGGGWQQFAEDMKNFPLMQARYQQQLSQADNWQRVGSVMQAQHQQQQHWLNPTLQHAASMNSFNTASGINTPAAPYHFASNPYAAAAQQYAQSAAGFPLPSNPSAAKLDPADVDAELSDSSDDDDEDDNEVTTTTATPIITSSSNKCAADVAAVEDREELAAFSRLFKEHRIKFGYTQADVGLALGTFYGHVFSQTTICRFESKLLSVKNMRKLRPLLGQWLYDIVTAEAKTAAGAGGTDGGAQRQHDELLQQLLPKSPLSAAELKLQVAAGSGRRRKKRTSIDAAARDALEMTFAKNRKPSPREIKQISTALDLGVEVVRVWFCNRRQKYKRSLGLSCVATSYGGDDDDEGDEADTVDRKPEKPTQFASMTSAVEYATRFAGSGGGGALMGNPMMTGCAFPVSQLDMRVATGNEAAYRQKMTSSAAQVGNQMQQTLMQSAAMTSSCYSRRSPAAAPINYADYQRIYGQAVPDYHGYGLQQYGQLMVPQQQQVGYGSANSAGWSRSGGAALHGGQQSNQ